MRYSNLHCFPFPDVNRLCTWPQVQIFRQAVNDQIWVWKKPDSSPAGQLLHLILSIRAPGARIHNLSYSLPSTLLLCTFFPTVEPDPSGSKSIGRMSGCSVERRRLPLVAAVQWRIVSPANQHTAHVTIFSLPPPIISHFQSVFCATGPIRKPASIWIKEDLWLVSLQHRFIERAGGRGEERSTSKRGW